MCVHVCVHLYSAFPIGLSLEEVREYEQAMQEKTNSKVKSSQNTGEIAARDLHCAEIPQRMGREAEGREGGETIQLDVRAVKVERARMGNEMKRAVSLKCIFVLRSNYSCI